MSEVNDKVIVRLYDDVMKLICLRVDAYLNYLKPIMSMITSPLGPTLRFVVSQVV